MQLQISTSEIKTIHKQQLFNGKNLHVFIYNKTESISGLHRHDYYEFTLALAGYHYQEVNGKHVLFERGNFVFIPLGSHHQSFYDFGVIRILSVGIDKRLFEQHYHPLPSSCFVAPQAYRANNSFLTHIETVIVSLNFREGGLGEFVEVVTLYIVNQLCRHRKEQVLDNILQWLKITVETMHDKQQFSENALENMVHLSAGSQEYPTRATQHYYSKTPTQIINEIRINFAKKQLEMTNCSVTDTVYESGYSNPSLFIKTFKKLTSFISNSHCKKLTEFNQQTLSANNPFLMAYPKQRRNSHAVPYKQVEHNTRQCFYTEGRKCEPEIKSRHYQWREQLYP